jgi:hypothetical protein
MILHDSTTSTTYVTQKHDLKLSVKVIIIIIIIIIIITLKPTLKNNNFRSTYTDLKESL